MDDDEALRALVSLVFETAGYDVVAVAAGDEALVAADAARPEAAIVDIRLPVLNGYEVVRALKERHAGVPVILISGERTESFDRAAGLMVGADDYVTKPFAPDELLARVRTLLERKGNGNGNGAQVRRGLTPRELEVLVCLADGLDVGTIAARLVISPKTVATHIERILGKLGAHTRAQAVAAAYKQGLVVPQL